MLRMALLTVFITMAANDSTQAQRVTRGRARTPFERHEPKLVELSNVPPWLKDHQFPQKSFTFVRIKYNPPHGADNEYWMTDYPDAVLNISAQFASLTDLDVSKTGLVLELTDPALMDHPFVYISQAGNMKLSDAEVAALREYTRRGGFVMIDDFWGEAEWQRVSAEMERAFPGHEPQELPLTHPLFHCVFPLNEKPQVPSIHAFLNGSTTERPDAPAAHYRVILADDDHVAVVMCHNTDLGDGWERIGIDERYTREVSQQRAVPLGINILFYALSQSTLPVKKSTQP